ncbi:MAG: MBL fold metallo-hydrolase [Patescibacteria group bacterium]
MVITYYGVGCFKVQSGETVIAFNPPSKESEYKSPRFASDMVLVSVNDKDYNGWENLPAKIEGEKPFVADSSGEYEVSGIYIKGIESNNHSNTVYGLSLEEISICHLGALGKEVNPKIKESLGDIDILFIPIGGGNLLEPQKAASVATHLGAKIVIPMNYNEIQLKQFIKEFGAEEVMPADKLTIKKKDLADKKGEIVVLKSVV